MDCYTSKGQLSLAQAGRGKHAGKRVSKRVGKRVSKRASKDVNKGVATYVTLPKLTSVRRDKLVHSIHRCNDRIDSTSPLPYQQYAPQYILKLRIT